MNKHLLGVEKPKFPWKTSFFRFLKGILVFLRPKTPFHAPNYSFHYNISKEFGCNSLFFSINP